MVACRVTEELSSAASCTTALSRRCSAHRIRSTTAPKDWVMSSGCTDASERLSRVETWSARLTASPVTVLSTRARWAGEATREKARSASCWLVWVAMNADCCSALRSSETRAAYEIASCSAVPALARVNAETARRPSATSPSPANWLSTSP